MTLSQRFGKPYWNLKRLGVTKWQYLKQRIQCLRGHHKGYVYSYGCKCHFCGKWVD